MCFILTSYLYIMFEWYYFCKKKEKERKNLHLRSDVTV